MGNNIGSGRKKAKVMKTNGESFKLKTPIQARDIMKGYPGHVLLESGAVEESGLRAKPLDPQEELRPKEMYFLVELPNFVGGKAPSRARSGINMSAKDRLECLMLSRRAVSDLSMRAPISLLTGEPIRPGPNSGPLRVKVRLPKAQLAKLMGESRDEGEVARKIIDLYVVKSVEDDGVASDEDERGLLHHQGEVKPGDYW